MTFTKHPGQHFAFRNRSTPFVNVVERLEQKALLIPASRKSSPILPENASLSASSKTRGQTPEGQPSSDPPSSTPPTPRETLLCPTPTITIADPVTAPAGFLCVPGKGPLYYDYGEDFEQFEKHVTQVYEEATSSPVPMGFVHRIKTLLEQRAASGQTSSPISPSSYSVTEKVTEPDIPELPASPVLKRITREMILAAIGPVSDVASSDATMKADGADSATPGQNRLFLTQPSIAELQADSSVEQNNRLSAPGSIASALNSSTADFEYALRYSIPASAASLQSDAEFSTPYGGNEEIQAIGQYAAQEGQLQECEHSQLQLKDQHSPDLLEGAPIAELEANIQPPTAHRCASGPIALSSQRSILTEYTAGIPSESRRASESNSDDARSIGVHTINEKEVAPSLNTPRIEVHHVTNSDAHDGRLPIHPQDEEVPRMTTGAASPISTTVTTECTPTVCRDSVSTTHLSVNWSYRKPIPSSTTPVASLKDSSSVKRSSMESTTDLHFSGYHSHAGHLPDLKEESETSLDRNSNIFRFPRPGSGIPAVPIDKIRRARDSLSSKAESKHNSVFKSHHTHSLSETQAIPSLQFSQINLFAKLNDAFELRRRSSMDGYAMFVAPTPERPADSDIIREKYRSLFGGLDAEHDTEEYVNDSDDSQHIDQEEDNEAVSSHTTLAYTAPTLRPLSPDELIAEVERLSIPSINGLTQRLSEFLPSLKKYYQPEAERLDETSTEEGTVVAKDPVDEAVEVTINEIRSIGKELESEDSEADLVEDDSTEASPSTSNNMRAVSTDIRPKSTPPEQRPATPLNLTQERPLHRDDTPLAELDTPTPAVLRSRSLSDSNVETQSNQIRISDAFRISRRSLIGSSPPESRPWNLDTSYPWASTNLDIAICLPLLSTQRKEGIKMQPSRLRLRVSSSSSSSSPSGTNATIQQSAHLSPSDAGDHTTSTADTFQHHRGHPQRGASSARATTSSQTARKASKRTLLGSLSRKIGLARAHSTQSAARGASSHAQSSSTAAAAAASAVALAAALPPCAAASPPADAPRPVDPGDRYPTSALLSPPGAAFAFAFAFDGEARSFFSEESSAAEGSAAAGARMTGRLRRRITAWREGKAGAEGAAYDCVDAMGRTEVRARRLLERIKAFWYRGGEILRSMSLRTVKGMEDDEGMSWLERAIVRSDDVQGLESALQEGSIAGRATSPAEIIKDETERVQELVGEDVVDVDCGAEQYQELKMDP